MPLFDFRSVCFPYCLDKNNNGFFVPRNREYRSLGHGRDDEEFYDGSKCSFKLSKSIIEKIAVSIHYESSEDNWRLNKISKLFNI